MAQTAAPSTSTATQQTLEPLDFSTSKSERVLAVSQSVFTILKHVSQLSTVPCLKEAATVACTLLQMVQDMKSNKQTYRSLVREVCALLACLVIDPMEMSDKLQTDIKDLTKDLEEIKRLCGRLVDRHPVIRFFLSQKDAGELNDIRARIEFNFKVFYLKSTISIREIQESWKGQENPQLTQILLNELKTQRDFMEITGATLAAIQLTANELSDNETKHVNAMQVIHGEHEFEDEVHTRNQVRAGSGYDGPPLQSFTGSIKFKGKVCTINTVT